MRLALKYLPYNVVAFMANIVYHICVLSELIYKQNYISIVITFLCTIIYSKLTLFSAFQLDYVLP